MRSIFDVSDMGLTNTRPVSLKLGFLLIQFLIVVCATFRYLLDRVLCSCSVRSGMSTHRWKEFVLFTLLQMIESLLIVWSVQCITMHSTLFHHLFLHANLRTFEVYCIFIAFVRILLRDPVSFLLEIFEILVSN